MSSTIARLRALLVRCYHCIPVVRELRQIRDDVRVIRYHVSEIHVEENYQRANDIMRLMEQDLITHPRYSDPKRLLHASFQVNSRAAEDGMIREIFARIGTTNKVFAEFGAGTGRENNTAFLLSQGWTGFWLDGSEDLVRHVQSRADLREGSVKAMASFLTRENIASLFAQMGVPQEFDLLSIDIDQNTYYVWEALQQYRPRVAVIEYNATLPPDMNWKVDYDPKRMWDDTHNFGASLKALELLGQRIGYSLVGCDWTGANAFFVRNDVVGDKFAAPFTAENHYEPPRYSLTIRRGHRAGILDRPQS